MRTIIKPGHIHRCRHIIVDYGIRSIHTLSDRTCGVFTMTNVLKYTRKFRTTVSVPLVGNLIADTPHHDTGIIAIVVNQIYQVILHPFIKYLMISILYFGIFPFIERLCHHHHTHLVTSTNQFGGRHVMGSTDGVATHILQYTNLTTNTRFVGYSSQRS